MGFFDWLTGDDEEENEEQKQTKPIGSAGGLKFLSWDILDDEGEEDEEEDDTSIGHEVLDLDPLGPGDWDSSKAAWAQEKKKHYGRNRFNVIHEDDNSIQKQTSSWRKMDDWQSRFHRHGEGNEDNSKYVSPDGHREIVYDSLGRRLISDENMGTYNYASPYTDSQEHISEDVIPYTLWGNTPKDKTPWYRRIIGS